MDKSVNTELSTFQCTTCQDEQAKSESNDSPDKIIKKTCVGFSFTKKPLRKFTYDDYFKPSRIRNTSHQFSTGSKLIPSSWLWKSHKGLIYGLSSQNIKQSTKIAMFDMDGTLIVNKNNRRITDWEFFSPQVPQKLRELRDQGYRIVVASNQLGVSLNLVSELDLQKKIMDFSSVIGVEMTVMLSIKNDKFRKPETGMWNFFLNTMNMIPVQPENCVGFS